jgi:secreted Zn-dependent insulinase-like peptidase
MTIYKQPIHALLVSLALALTALPTSASTLLDPQKSPNDERSYGYFRLDNGLQVLLISEPDTDKAAAALDVHVGSSDDPEDRQGLAHFLEHMLFLGTEKYPEAGDYQSFINTHGGSNNAYTDFDHTNYFFDVDKDYLEPVLDRFAQFFVAPLFSEQYVEREKHAVDSEYKLKLKNDGWRRVRALKQVVNPEHPFAKFTVGSLDTLSDRGSDPVREDLLAFYAEHYSADRMALVILGKEPLDQLRQWAEEKFAAVATTDTPEVKIEAPLFTPGTLPARLDMIPQKDRQMLDLTFPIEPADAFFREKPVLYLANLLGHEGEGSLLSLLKDRSWAKQLAVHRGRTLGNTASFEVSIELTDEGLNHIEAIVEDVFRYLEMAMDDGIQEWLYEEQHQLAELGFRFQEKAAAMGYASSLARRLHRFPADEVLTGPYTMERFDEDLIRRYGAQLTPDNVLVKVTAKGLETDAVEPRFGVNYRLSKIDPATLSRWRGTQPDSQLALPQANMFLPEDLALTPLTAESERPVKLSRASGIEVWYKQDSQFRLPRADMRVAVRSRVVGESPRHLVLTKLYTKLVVDQLAEYTYPALLAGLHYGLTAATNGFTLEIGGYNDKQDVLLDRILSILRDPDLDPQRFANQKRDLQRSLENAKHETPYRQALGEIPRKLIESYWSEPEQLQALDALTLEDLAVFAPKLFAKIQIVGLIHGNISRDDAIRFAGILERDLLVDAETDRVPLPEVAALAESPPRVLEIDVDNNNSANVLYFQGADKEIPTQARYALLAQLLATPFYQDLRTDKQLGYVVFASPMPLLELPGITFVVQSPVASPEEIEAHMERFLSAYDDTLATLDDAQLEQTKAGLISRILEQPQTLSQQTGLFWRDLRYGHLKFDSRERLASSVGQIDVETLRDAYRATFTGEAPRQLVVRSRAAEEPGNAPIESGERGAEAVADSPP